VAIGNPFGYESSVTTGVLSATGRDLQVPTSKGNIVYKNLVQTTALINPGNSGGPLINIDGELIGINTAIRADAQGIGFAIPVDKVREVVATLFSFQVKKKLWLGATVEAGKAGVVVKTVHDRSPAQAAGLRKGDVIVQADGAPVGDLLGYAKYMFKRRVGDTVRLAVDRRGKRRTVAIKLQAVPKPSGEKLAQAKLGLTVQTLTPALARRLRMRLGEGVLIVDLQPGSPGDKAGLKSGDVIVQIGRYLVRNVDELGTLLEAIPAGAVVQVVVVRRGSLGRTRIQVR